MRKSAGVLSAGIILSAAASATLGLGAPPAAALTGSGPTGSGGVPVIVFLKAQPKAKGGSSVRSEQRAGVIKAAQAPYLSELRRVHATGIKTYHLVDAFAATVPAAEVSQLAASPGVAQVIPDSPIFGPDPASAGTPKATGTPKASPTASPTASSAPTAAPRMLPGACSKSPQLEPEGLALTGTDSQAPGATTARSLGYTGAGVKVAFLADGLDPSNVNFLRGGKSVITDYKDFSGDGISAPTGGGEAFSDANAIAGQGTHVYDARGFSAQSPASPCDIRIEGFAPGASLVALKVFSNSDVSSTSGFLQAIDYAVSTDHVNVLNESFGTNPFPDVSSLDAVKQFNDAATAAGVTVVVASGDAGPFNTIGSPATDPDVLSVGASTDFRFYAQTDYAGADQFATNGWLDDNISALSSGGYTQTGTTVDMVAPGDLSFASCTADPALYADCANFLDQASPIEESGGTSEAAPEVAGAAALVIQAYRQAHHGTTPSPATVRQILLSTATDLGAPATGQGAGLLDSLKAVRLASSRQGDPDGQTLEVSPNQLNAVGAPGARKSWQVTVTNTGAARQTVAVSGRTFGAPTVVKTGSVTLGDTTSPHFTNWTGTRSDYGLLHFTVPAGAGRLDASIAWPASVVATSGTDTVARLVLVDPSGRLAGYSLPQGAGGYGAAEVLHPAAGTWTAVIFGNAAHGTNGKVLFGASVSRSVPFGSVTPSSLTLAPGASARVKVSAVVPAGAGDTSGSVVLDSGNGATSIPVTLRGLVSVSGSGSGSQGGTFSGVLTGGNGRAPGEGQVASYEFTVPAHVRSLAADVALASDPANEISAYLVAPGGQTMGYGSDNLTTGFTHSAVPVETPERTLSVYAANPVSGTWTLIVDFTSPVPGNTLADRYTGRIRFNTTKVTPGGLPSSASRVLARGKAVTYPVRITNTGTAPEDVFLDARRDSQASYSLQPQDTVASVSLPLPESAEPPEWIVPTMTQSVQATAASKQLVMFDFGSYPGDPDTASSIGPQAAGVFPASALPTPVTPGLWYAVPSQVGPYPADGAAAVTASMAMTATTAAFDPSVTSPVGDFWQFGVRPLAAKASYNLFVVNPGQTRTINVTIKPTGPAGTVVTGTLYVDDFVDSMSFLSGSQLAALPYSYKIG
jgi:hypothetical protein